MRAFLFMSATGFLLHLGLGTVPPAQFLHALLAAVPH